MGIESINSVPFANIGRRSGKAIGNIAKFNQRNKPAAAGPAFTSTEYHFEDQTRAETHGGDWSPSNTHSTWANGTSAVNGSFWGRTSNKTVKGWNCGEDNSPSGNTGPAGGVVTSTGGHSTAIPSDMYLYSEVSSNKNAYAFVTRMPGFNFSTEMGDTSRDLNLKFWVHAFGSQTGDLYVYIDDATTSNHSSATELAAYESWSGFTATTSLWQQKTISLNSYRTINSTHYIYFLTQNATGFRGDLAIDAIQIVESE